MFCKKCGYTLEDNAVFCSNCGTPTSETSNSNIQEPISNISNTDKPIDVPNTENHSFNQQQNFNPLPNMQQPNIPNNPQYNAPYSNIQTPTGPTGTQNKPGNFNYQQQTQNSNAYNQQTPNNYTPQNPNNYNQQQNSYNNWQQNPNQLNNYPRGPVSPKKNNQNTVIAAIIAVIVIGGLLFGAYMLFFKDKGGSSGSGTDTPPVTTTKKTIKDIIVGTWDAFEVGDETSLLTLTFQKNGSLTISQDGETQKGTYTIDESDKSNIRIELISDDGEVIAAYVKKVNDNKLQLIQEDDVSEEDPLTLVRKK